MSDWLSVFSSLWFWILIGLALIILLAVVILSAVVRASRADAPAPAAAQPAALPPGEPAAAAEPEQPSTAESPATSFSRAMRFLRSTVSGRDYRYQIPWYLVIGDRGSGKSALMRSVGVDLAGSERGSRGGLGWRFLDRGILIGVSGRYVGGSGHGDRDWNGLLRLLQNNRPRRPVDGIVLTVAASDLVGPTALDETQLSARAGRFSEMLAYAQRTLGFVLPVYVIVTKCDEMEGFSAFCRELPSRTRDDIFGWSSPYQLDASFAPEWVDEAFNGISQDLQRLQSEILVERSELSDPDAVFLFPDEFARMRPLLGVYLERLFRETAYREGFRFRGLYFSGDISEPAIPLPQPEDEEELGIEHLLPGIVPPPRRVAAFQASKSPAFVKRLFEEKIFSECGLGRPMARVFLTKSRTVSYIQAAAAIVALILLAGTWFSTRRLSGDRDRILPALEKMAYALPKTEGPAERRAFGLGLLKSLDLAANVNFWSVFQPASWFSPLNENVTLVMKAACEQWVLSAIQAELEQRKAALLYPPAPVQDASASPAKSDGPPAEESTDGVGDLSIAGLESAPEYQRLSSLVNQLRSLGDATSIYETLRQQDQAATPDRIRKLLSYLDLSDVRPSGHLAIALSQANGPSAAFAPADVAAASELVRTLIGDLLRDWFENNEAWADVEQLRQSISDLQRGRLTTYEQLKTLLALTTQVQNDFTDPNFRWLGATNMDLPAALQRVSVNPLAGPNDTQLVTFARVQGDGYFTRLRNNLRDERTALTDGALLDLKNPIDLSPGSKKLQAALLSTLNLPFMDEPVKPDPIQITLQANRRLVWRLDPLLEAQRLVKSYTDFIQALMHGGDADALRQSLSRIAVEQLTTHVQRLIVQSQTFQPGSASMSGPGGDAAVLEEVNAFRDAAPPLEQLSDQFNGFGQTYIHNAVLRIMVLQAYDLLSTLDSRLKSEQPYAIKPGAWNGAGALSFAVFGVTSQPALTNYLGGQRDRIKFFEQQAEPLVPFLTQYMPVQATEQTQLIRRWKGLIDDFQQYASKGASTLAGLEDFVVTGIDKIPAAACKASPPEPGSDYFVQIRNQLEAQLSNRCRDVTASTVCSAYSALAADFNVKLAGKFPFSSGPALTRSEATPDDIVAFYKIVDSRGKPAHDALKASLDDDTRFGADGHKAREFLEQVDDLRPLVLPASPDAAKELPFALDVVPRFRTNRAQESGGNQVIDWTMQVGGQIFQSKDPEHPGRWRASNPVRLSLRWANDSVYAPTADPSQPDLTVRGRNAYFEFTNEWALLAFLRRHEALPSELGPASEPGPYTLKFRIKTVSDPKWAESANQPAAGSATVFMYMKISPAGGKDVIRIPVLPVSAPPLATGCGPS